MTGADDPKPADRTLPDDGDLPADNGDLSADNGDFPPDDGDLPPLDDGGVPPLDEVDVRELLRGALRPALPVPPNLLRGVQRRLRTRSRGKFYGDGWSTARSPRSTYLVTSVFMLVVIALLFIVLIPWSGGALP